MTLPLRIALVAIGILVLGGLGVWLLGAGPRSATNTNATTGNANLGPTVAEDPVGTPLNANVRLGSVTLAVVKTFRAATYRITAAGSGQEFIVVQFRPLAAGATDVSATAAEARLQAGGERYAPRIVELPTVAESPEGLGTLAFPVPVGSVDPVLVLPDGTTLPLPV